MRDRVADDREAPRLHGRFLAAGVERDGLDGLDALDARVEARVADAHVDRLARRDVVGGPDRAPVFARRDGVAAGEHLQRAEGVEAGGGALQVGAALRERRAPERAEAMVEARQLGALSREDGPRMQGREPPLGVRASVSRRRAIDVRARATRRASRSSSVCWCAAMASRGSPSRRATRPWATRPWATPAVHGAREVHARAPQELALRPPVGDDHLRGLRRRRRARVGREVHERHVHVVTDGADDRDAARRDGAHDGLFVERGRGRRPSRRRGRGR